jgi:hypothetical protein
MFYSWAFRRGLIDRVPFEYDTLRAPITSDAQLLGHLHSGDTLPALDLTVREYRSIPTALTIAELQHVRTHLNPREALIADWAVSTGARRMVLGLTVHDIPGSHAPNCAVRFDPDRWQRRAEARPTGATSDHRPN